MGKLLMNLARTSSELTVHNYPMKDRYCRHADRLLADRIVPQLTFTYGGLKCDLDSRVLSTTGAPIPSKNDSAICFWKEPFRETGFRQAVILTTSRSVLRRRAKRLVLQRGKQKRVLTMWRGLTLSSVSVYRENQLIVCGIEAAGMRPDQQRKADVACRSACYERAALSDFWTNRRTRRGTGSMKGVHLIVSNLRRLKWKDVSRAGTKAGKKDFDVSRPGQRPPEFDMCFNHRKVLVAL